MQSSTTSTRPAAFAAVLLAASSVAPIAAAAAPPADAGAVSVLRFEGPAGPRCQAALIRLLPKGTPLVDGVYFSGFSEPPEVADQAAVMRWLAERSSAGVRLVILGSIPKSKLRLDVYAMQPGPRLVGLKTFNVGADCQIPERGRRLLRAWLGAIVAGRDSVRDLEIAPPPPPELPPVMEGTREVPGGTADEPAPTATATAARSPAETVEREPSPPPPAQPESPRTAPPARAARAEEPTPASGAAWLDLAIELGVAARRTNQPRRTEDTIALPGVTAELSPFVRKDSEILRPLMLRGALRRSVAAREGSALLDVEVGLGYRFALDLGEDGLERTLIILPHAGLRSTRFDLDDDDLPDSTYDSVAIGLLFELRFRGGLTAYAGGAHQSLWSTPSGSGVELEAGARLPLGGRFAVQLGASWLRHSLDLDRGRHGNDELIGAAAALRYSY